MNDYFKVHVLNDSGIAKAKVMQIEFEKFASNLEELMGDNRHKSIAMTKLEEACFFAKKSMACDSKNQK